MPIPPTICRSYLRAAASSTDSIWLMTRKQNYPLPNLFVSMLQRMGLEESRFASSSGTIAAWKWSDPAARS